MSWVDPGAGSGTRTGLPAGGAGVLEVRPGPVVPARVRARLVLPVPARHGSAVHDQGPGLVRVVCGRHEACEDLDRTGRPPADGPAGRGLTRPRTTRPARLGRGRAAGGPVRPRSLPPGSVPVAARWSAGYGGDCGRGPGGRTTIASAGGPVARSMREPVLRTWDAG